MRKLYTLMVMATAMTLSSQALPTREQSIGKIETAEGISFVADPVMKKFVQESTESPRRAVGFKTIEDVAGDYDVSFQGLLQDMGGFQTKECVITVSDAAKGEVEITGLMQDILPIKASVDIEKGTFTIPNMQLVGRDSQGDVFLYFKEADSEGYIVAGASSASAVVGTISNKTITMPELSIWAVGNPETENVGWYFLGYSFVLTRNNWDNPNEGWIDFGTGEFTDGWMVPAAGVATDTWTVNIQRSEYDENLFRLVNPYAAEGSPFVQMADPKGGYIVFSIADPDFVEVIPNQYSGIKNKSVKLSFTNIEGFFVAQGISSEQIKRGFTNVSEWSNYKDKVVNFYNCRFTKGEGNTYFWSDENGASLADKMKSRLVFEKDPTGGSGVDGIVSDEEAEAIYFNMQGIRVENPATGELVIVRKGNKSSKMIVR